MANKFPPTTRRLSLPSSDAKYVPRAAGSRLSDAMRKCFPSGRNLGLTNTLLGSFARTGSGLAPAPVTLYNAPSSGTKRMREWIGPRACHLVQRALIRHEEDGSVAVPASTP